MAIRYSGCLRIDIRPMDVGGIGRFYYRGTVYGPKGKRWSFRELSPPPGAVPGPEGLAIDHPEAYDRVAAEALQWAWIKTRDEMGTEGWVFDNGEFHPDHETEDRFVVSRKPPHRADA